MDLHLSISSGFVSSKIYDKRDEFDHGISIFPFLDGDVPRRPSYGVFISQLKRFARVCSHVVDLNTCKNCLTDNLSDSFIGIISLGRLFPSSIVDTMKAIRTGALPSVAWPKGLSR